MVWIYLQIYLNDYKENPDHLDLNSKYKGFPNNDYKENPDHLDFIENTQDFPITVYRKSFVF